MRKSWQNWLAKRFKLNQAKQLSQKDVLVFVYQQGYLYLVLILITFVAGINYANNLILAFCFLISAVLCISFYVTFKQLHGVKIELVGDELGQVGQMIHLHLHLKQAHAQPRYLYVETDGDVKKIVFSETKQTLTLPCYATQRGQFKYPIIKIYSIYPFGLVRAWTYLYHQHLAWVAPKAQFTTAENKQSAQSFEPEMDEFRELRNYQLGDSLQAVSWKQAARGQGLYIKVFEQYQQQQGVDIYYEHMPSTSHEERLSLMMGLIEQCEQNQCPYSVHLPHAQLDKGQGFEQLNQAKRLLAQA